ncbi:hypothetical protein KAW08_02355 [bacterium]|nr:hypothetical protein [bacterium]
MNTEPFPREFLPGPVLDEYPDWIDLYYYAWELSWKNIEIIEKEGWQSQMSCMPGQGNIWQWDSCFMTMFTKFASSLYPGMNNLDNLYRLQREDGYISMAYIITTEQPAYGELVNPPLYAWAEWEYFKTTNDSSRLQRVFPILVKYYNWLKQNRRRDNGLYWFENTGASGMDNAPRGVMKKSDGAGGLCHIDFSSQQALSARCLFKISNLLKDNEKETFFKREFSELKTAINNLMWDEKTGFYYDIFEDFPNKLNHKTIASFWPIIAGVADLKQVDRLIEHLVDKNEFNRPHRVPTLSYDDPNFDPMGGYWLGSVWAPTTYMVVKGLEKAGGNSLAREISMNHMNNICRVWKEYKPSTLWECYSSEYLNPGTNKKGRFSRPNFVGWTGLGPIAMLIEHVIGIQLNANENKIIWSIGLLGRHGIKNLHFGADTIDLICESRTSAQEFSKIRTKCKKPFKLEIRIAEQKRTFEIAASGEQILTFDKRD